MKARHIRKLRKRILSYHTYKVYPVKHCLFGFDNNFVYTFKAMNSIHAVERYMKYYWRKNKQKHPSYQTFYHEVTCDWGRILVIEEKGYKRYYM